MKNSNLVLMDKIMEIRDELERKLIDDKMILNSDEVLDLSRELDELIVAYLYQSENKNTCK